MGNIFSRFRKNESVVETLEKLENDIRKLEEFKISIQAKRAWSTKIIYAVCMGVCIFCTGISYFKLENYRENFFYIGLTILCVLIFMVINKLITWYYQKQIKKNQSKLITMKEKKKKILNDVMDKETYKVAKQILEKFSQDIVPKPTPPTGPIINQNVRQRAVTTYKNPNSKYTANVMTNQLSRNEPRSNSRNLPQPRPLLGSGQPMLKLPAPVPSLNRGYVDKLVEYLIGDGPNNRYALICSRCHSHNGMALKEEFEYTSFKCCYCFFYNPARKLRPKAPKLQAVTDKPFNSDTDSDSHSSLEENKTLEPKNEVVNSDNATEKDGESDTNQNKVITLSNKSNTDTLESSRESSDNEMRYKTNIIENSGEYTNPDNSSDLRKILKHSQSLEPSDVTDDITNSNDKS